MRWLRAFEAGLAMVLLVTLPPVTGAQGVAVVGVVADRHSGSPLSNALVRSDADTNSVRTDGRGMFRLLLLGGEATVRVTRIGYVPASVRVRPGADTVRVEMEQKSLDLDAVIVTGQAGASELRSLANAVGRIDVAGAVRSAPPAKLQDLLSVNVPGVRVMSAGGSVGTGGVTRIRGAASLALSNEPLIYVDGVRTDNANGNMSTAYGRALGYFGKIPGYGWEVPSRVNDIDPEEIESIEVIRGPAAAALYGTEAANGVIQILTKRGAPGAAAIDSRISGGLNWLPDQLHRWSPAWFVNNAGELQSFNILEYNRRTGYPDVFTTGHPMAAAVSLSGGSDAVRFFASADANRDEGIVDYNWQNRFSARGNLSYARGTLNVDANASLTRSRTRTASGAWPITSEVAFANCGADGQVCRDMALDARTDTTFNHGWFRRPEDFRGNIFAYDNIDRNIVGMRISQAPRSWLTHRLQLGADLSANLGDNMVIKNAMGPAFEASQGYRAISNLRTSYYTLDYVATASYAPTPNLSSNLSASAQYYQKTREYVSALGQGFAVPGPGDISGATYQSASQDYIPNKTLGLYLQEQVGWNRRVFLTAALRGDDNSAFGANYDFVLYPKVGLSWILSDEPRFADRLGPLQTVKLRVAYGRAGQQPDAFSAVPQYQPVVSYGGQPGVTPVVAGNPNLRPEVAREIEAGFDASLGNERASIEFTWYDKMLHDAIIAAPIRPSSGFPGVRLINSGRIRNSGVELGVTTVLLQRQRAEWSVRAGFATNGARVQRLLPNQNQLFVGEVITQYNVVGFAPYSYFFRRVVSSNVLTEPDPAKWRALCAGGAAFSNGDGSTVPCESANILYAGRPTPSWSGSLSSTLRLGQRWEFFALIDMTGGGSMVSGDVGFGNDVGGPGRTSVATKAVMDSVKLHGNFVNTEKILPYADGRLAGHLLLAAPDGFAVNGLIKTGFARLRTVSATYALANTIVSRLGARRGSLTLAADNLAMLWREQESVFGRTLVDPEIAQNNKANGLEQYHQERWPQSTRATFVVRLSY